jgi:type VI secretion system protein ImpJ
MKQLQPVIWTKGTFLTPQHLQVQDRFLEDTLHFRLQALKFCPWGFKELTLDQAMLTEGQLVVSSASGIFPDGLLFDIPEADPPPPSKALDDLFEGDTRSLDIYLTVPDYRLRGVNVSAGRNASSRYVAADTLFRDENTGSGDKPVRLARKNFRLLGENENREGYSALQIANVTKTEGGTFRLTPRFIPPLIDIHSNEYLMVLLRGLIEILSARSSQLAASRRQKNESLADFTATDIANFWLLYTINSHFPIFNHLFQSKISHPEELYSAMLELAGSLTTFSSKLHPRDFPLYVHDSLGPMFSELDQKLRSMLQTVVRTNVVSLPLKLVKNSIYAATLDDERYLRNTRMYLAISAETKEDAIIRDGPRLVKVCSATNLEYLIKQALPGVQLKHLPSPPDALSVKLKYQYFSLSQSGGAWEAVARARSLAAYVPDDFPNPKLELLILLPEAD